MLEKRLFKSDTEKYELWLRTMRAQSSRLWHTTEGLGKVFELYNTLPECFTAYTIEVMTPHTTELFSEFMNINWNTLLEPYEYDASIVYTCFEVYRMAMADVVSKSITDTFNRMHERVMREFAHRPTQASVRG